MSKNQYYYKRNIGDYIRDTRDLTMQQHGAYALLLDYYYTNNGFVFDNFIKKHEELLKNLQKICNCASKKERQDIEFILHKFFTKSDAGWSNKRADEEIAKYRKISDSARKSAAGRWDKKDANAYANVDANAHTNVMPPHIETHNGRNAKQETRNKKQETIKDSARREWNSFFDLILCKDSEKEKMRELWNEWFDVRYKNKKLKHTERAAMSQINMLNANKAFMIVAIETAIDNGWQNIHITDNMTKTPRRAEPATGGIDFSGYGAKLGTEQ